MDKVRFFSVSQFLLSRELQNYLGCFLALFPARFGFVLSEPKKSLRKPLQIISKFPLSSFILVVLAVVFSSCAWHPRTPEYRAQYCYLKNPPAFDSIKESSYFLVVLVCARRLDYTSGGQLIKTIARHPSDVGHAWVLLHGDNGVLEGGHTGEFGVVQPRYFEGVADLVERGDSNPARYFWEAQKDGCFQRGSGGFVPTFAAYVELTAERYWAIREYILEGYRYSSYAITGRQCAVFAASVAALAGLELEHAVTVPLEPVVKVGGERVRLWSDGRYARLPISTPDVLERSLIKAVREGKAKNATQWYLKRYSKKRHIF